MFRYICTRNLSPQGTSELKFTLLFLQKQFIAKYSVIQSKSFLSLIYLQALLVSFSLLCTLHLHIEMSFLASLHPTKKLKLA